MRGIGRGRITGQDRRNLFRLQDRNTKTVAPRTVHHTSFLPQPASRFPGLIIYVAGTINAHYKSDGTSWTAL